MKSVPKLIRRFLGILIISFILIFILNIVLLVVSTINRTSSGGPYTLANEIGTALKKNEKGYELDQTSLETLEKENIWAICIDDATHHSYLETFQMRGVCLNFRQCLLKVE